MNSDKEQLRNDAMRLFKCSEISDTKDMLFILSECLFRITNFQKDQLKENRANADANIVLQMIFSKVLNLNKMLEGVAYEAMDDTQLNNIIDPTVIAVVIRNVVETIAMFNLIYTKKNEERTLMYNLWVIAGLKYRQRFGAQANSDDSKNKIANEMLTIENLINEIKQLSIYQTLSPEGQKTIERKIKEKDYKLKITNGNITSLSWQELISNMDIKPGLMDDMYTYFSLYSHPSNVSVFQFANLFKKTDPHYLNMSNFNVLNMVKLICLFIDDYIELFPNTLNAFESLPTIHQIAINFHDQFLRASSKTINDALDLLE